MAKRFLVTVNGQNYEVEIEEISESNQTEALHSKVAARINTPEKLVPVEKPVQSVMSKPTNPEPKIAKTDISGLSVSAPMPGTILDLKVILNGEVKKGQVLVVLEAMKMENEIVAPKDGIVSAINAQKGSTVNAGEILLIIA